MARYVAPIFLGAFLLFQVQPIIARYILPWFGGTPAVWTTCMLFFQVILLLGYLYAHLVISRLRPRAQAVVHGVLLAASVALLGWLATTWEAPILPGAGWKPPDVNWPVWRIVQLLAASVGLPYFILASTSPMLQAWFSRTHVGKSPYRLYTLSNVGSLLALLTYPFIVEPALAVRAQAWIWAIAYVVYVGGYAVCAYFVKDLPAPAPVAATQAAGTGPDTAPTWHVKWLWIGLPALASMLLLAITNQLCQQVAVIPFLWIVPLSLYLLSFIICFDSPRWYIRRAFVPALLLLVPICGWVIIKQQGMSVRTQIAAFSLALFACCMVCHGEVVAAKPRPRYLTSFYLGISIGGAIGGLFVGVIAPLIFRDFYELYIGLVLCWFLGLFVMQHDERLIPVVGKWFGRGAIAVSVLAVPVALTWAHSWTMREQPNSMRNFYGICWVNDVNPDEPEWHTHVLLHGRIIHGFQFLAPEKRRMPCSYFGPDTGIGLALQYHPRRLSADPTRRTLRIGILGLGSGGLAVYANRGDFLRYYEINPDVVYLARDSGLLTFVTDCPAQNDIVMGDGRLSLERELVDKPMRYDVLMMDAFSGDSVPAHLLTKEAFDVYARHLRNDDSMIVVNITNRMLDLRPVVYKAAEAMGMQAFEFSDRGDQYTTYTAEYMVLTKSRTWAREPQVASHIVPRGDVKEIALWTDDYHNMFQILK
jgi:spermidine synthase